MQQDTQRTRGLALNLLTVNQLQYEGIKYFLKTFFIYAKYFGKCAIKHSNEMNIVRLRITNLKLVS